MKNTIYARLFSSKNFSDFPLERNNNNNYIISDEKNKNIECMKCKKQCIKMKMLPFRWI